MGKTIATLALIMLVGACGTKGGTGFTDTQVPMTGEFEILPGTKHKIHLISADGWTCSGPFDAVAYSYAQRAVYPFKLTCDNGDKGNAVYSVPTFIANRTYQPGQTQVSFSLESGVKGYVKF